jgi:hypothetical protein
MKRAATARARGQAPGASALARICASSSSLAFETIPDNRLQDPPLAGVRHAVSGADIEFPVRRPADVNRRKHEVVLFRRRIEVSDRTGGVVLQPGKDAGGLTV